MNTSRSDGQTVQEFLETFRPQHELGRPGEVLLERILEGPKGAPRAKSHSACPSPYQLQIAREFEENRLRKEIRVALARELETKRKKARITLARELRASRKHLRELKRGLETRSASAKISLFDNLEKTRRMARLSLASDLKVARDKLRKLRKTVWELKEQITRMFEEELVGKYPYSEQIAGFPPIPQPTFKPDIYGAGLPALSGIYFLWDAGRIAYVGKSIKICDRVRLGSHHALKASDSISFLLLPTPNLTWAEHYYIGIARPSRNDGGER